MSESNKMEDTRKLHDKVSGDAPQGSNAYVVDPAEWEEMKQKLARVDRKSRVAACFAWMWGALIAGIVQTPCKAVRRVGVGCAEMCRTVVAGIRCMVKALIFGALWVLKTVTQSVVAIPTLFIRTCEWNDMYFYVPILFSVVTCYFVTACLASYFGIPRLYAFAPILCANLMSLAYEIGRAKELDAAREAKIMEDARKEVAKSNAQKPVSVAIAPIVTAPISDRIAKLTKVAKVESLPLTITDFSLADLVANGEYESVDPDIDDAHFSSRSSDVGERNAVLVCFGEYVETHEAKSALDAMGLLPAFGREGVHFGAQYPNRQLENPIVCLGDHCMDDEGDRYVLVLGLDICSERGELALFDLIDRWCGCHRFLALRK